MNMADKVDVEDDRTLQDFQDYDVGDRLRIVGHAGYVSGDPYIGTVERVLSERYDHDREVLDKRTRYVLKHEPRRETANHAQLKTLKFGILHDFLELEGLMGKPPEEIILAGDSSATSSAPFATAAPLPRW